MQEDRLKDVVSNYQHRTLDSKLYVTKSSLNTMTCVEGRADSFPTLSLVDQDPE